MTHSIEGQKPKHIIGNLKMRDLNVGSIRGWIVCYVRHLRDCCGSTGVQMQIGLMICLHLCQVQQEQSYSSLHSGQSLAWDHVRSNINDPCGVIANFCRAIADPCGVVAIPEP